jgi:hypothetical protein
LFERKSTCYENPIQNLIDAAAAGIPPYLLFPGSYIE